MTLKISFFCRQHHLKTRLINIQNDGLSFFSLPVAHKVKLRFVQSETMFHMFFHNNLEHAIAYTVDIVSFAAKAHYTYMDHLLKDT